MVGLVMVPFLALAQVWTPTAGNMVTNRSYHRAVLLKTGKVLVMGGYSDSVTPPQLNSAELYDPKK